MFYFFSANLFSQTYSNKESARFAFTVGMTSSNLVKDSIHYKSGILFDGGFVYMLVLGSHLNLGLELLYEGKAFKNDSPIIKYRYFYVDVPLYLQINLSESIRLNVGGQYSKYTSSQVSNVDGSANSGTGAHTRNFNNIKDQDYSFLLGAEIDLNNNVSMGARYTLSGSTFFEQNKPNFGVFQLSFKYIAFRSYRQIFHTKESTK